MGFLSPTEAWHLIGGEDVRHRGGVSRAQIRSTTSSFGNHVKCYYTNYYTSAPKFTPIR
jgi:hypothetical protein